MTHRERVLRALEHAEPDRIPLDLGSVGSLILEALDIDFRHLWLDSPDKPKAAKNPDGTVRDEWGILWSAEGSYPVHFPLKGATENDVASYRWPLPEGRWDLSALKARAE